MSELFHGGRWRVAALAMLLWCGHAAAQSDAPWHAKGHTHRAIVAVSEWRSGEVDTAVVRLRHAGVMQDGADDLRIYDADGQRVPYEVAYHHPARDTLVKFRARPGEEAFYFYFGNADAARDPYRTVQSDALGIAPPQPGPAAEGWIPRAGLVLTTMRRPPEAPNPETIDEFEALVARSPGLDGAGLRRNISDGLNPFGDSDHYVSLYHGWLRIPENGEYSFCTASNEASFSFIDGEELVHWPGRHTEQRGKLGQKSATHTLEAGLHYVTYLHEEVLLYQVAFLGYRPPGGGHFVAIPDGLFVQPHEAVVRRYERQGEGATVMPRGTLRDSVWPSEREHGQYTRFRFAAEADDLSDWTLEWSFGDGQTATGRKVEHVYLATGEYDVTLRAVSPDGRAVERAWPVTVFPIEHLEAPFERGEWAAYVPIVETYDPAGFDAGGLVELAHFFDQTQRAQQAREIAEHALERGKMDAEHKAEMRLLAAGEAGKLDSVWSPTPARDKAQRARAHLEAARKEQASLHVTARLIRHVGMALDDPETAAALYEEATLAAREGGMTRDVQAGLREATIAMGDVHLVARQFEEAETDYRTAEALARPRVPQPVRAAQIGGYAETIAQALDEGRIEDAATVARRWRERFPAHLLTGEPLFWIGKVELQRDAPARAVRPLELAIECGQGAPFEAEAHWRLAEAHGQAGDEAARRAVLEALVRTGLAGEYRDRAVAELEAE
ncbi:MAG: PKD domain-containing protein [Phycisphaeraceae bacterium]